jgi:hypothetical protein
MVGAHLDSVPQGPGINDNASGAAGILAIAEVLAGTETANAVRFAWGARRSSACSGPATTSRTSRPTIPRRSGSSRCT